MRLSTSGSAQRQPLLSTCQTKRMQEGCDHELSTDWNSGNQAIGLGNWTNTMLDALTPDARNAHQVEFVAC